MKALLFQGVRETKASQLTDQEIINGCRKGRKRAQDELYRRYSGRLFGLCLRYTRNRMEAEDVLQEGFVKIFKKIDTFREDAYPALYAWLHRVMVNTAINYLRDNRKFRFTESIELTGDQWPDITDGGSLYDLFDHIKHDDILKIINGLPDGYRTVFNLFAFEEYGHTEIAAMLNISVNTSKTQLMKARRMIIGKLEQKILSDYEIKMVAQ
jgi:RNA polymerase sigma factor (sigma-70 family)